MGMFAFRWILGSLSPLEVLRGMADISVRRWQASPLAAVAKLLLLLLGICGIVIIAGDPGKGFVLLVGSALGFYAVKRHDSN